MSGLLAPVQVRYIFFPLNVLVGKPGKCCGLGTMLGRVAGILTLYLVQQALDRLWTGLTTERVSDCSCTDALGDITKW